MKSASERRGGRGLGSWARLAATLAATVAALCMSLASAPASAQEAQDYTVREGDTCGRIARRVYGNSRRYDLIHESNPELGAMPHRLRPGTVLRLPAASGLGDADATVTAARRQVRSQRPRRSQWDPAQVGQELNRGWRVSTGERSSAELTFQSGSVAALRAETLVIVYGNGARQAREEGAHAVVRGGSMLSRLSALSGGTPLQVETPTAVATLDAGESSIDVDEDGTTRVAAHRGRSARVRNREAGSAEVEVPEGNGSIVRQGQPPTPPRPLPAAPAWAPDQPSRFLGLSDHGGTLRGSWLPVADARTYRVEVARREDGRELVVSSEVPASVTSLEFHRLPAGRYYVRVITIDAEHFEGRPGAPVELEVVGVSIVPPGAEPPAPLDAQAAMLSGLDGVGDIDFERPAPARVPVLQGSRLLSPDGVTCAAGASSPSSELVFETLGEQHLTCVDAEGQNIVGMDVGVLRMTARLVAEDGTALTSLTRGQTRAVRVTWEPASTPPLGMGLTGSGLTLQSIEAHPDGGLLAEAIVPVDAPAEVVVNLARGNAILAETRTAVSDVEVAPEPAPVDDGPIVTRVPEALGLAGTPSAVGLQDERRPGSGIWLSLGLSSARLGENEVRLRAAAGVRASFLEERLRIDAMIPLDIIGVSARRADLGSRDVFAAVSSLILNGEAGLGLAASAGIWVPTASDQGLNAGRLQVAADLSWRTDDGLVTLRTRQAGIFDLVADESMLWASAYGVDIAIYGPLVVGVEGDMTLGQEDLRDWYAGSAAVNVGLDVDPVFVSLGFRYGFGDDLFPEAMLVGNVRGSFDP